MSRKVATDLIGQSIASATSDLLKHITPSQMKQPGVADALSDLLAASTALTHCETKSITLPRAAVTR